MPPDAWHRLPVESAGRGALSARLRSRRGGRPGDARTANRQGRTAAQREQSGDPGVRFNMRFVKPLDAGLVLQLAREHELLVTVEENTVQGGAGSAVAECLAQHGIAVPLLHLGLPDNFIEQGTHAQMLADCGLDAAGLVKAIGIAVAKKV